jgi:hypothetical protein
MDDITKQLGDLVFENEDLNKRFKKRAMPIIIGSATFNIILIILLLVLIYQVRCLRHLPLLQLPRQ